VSRDFGIGVIRCCEEISPALARLNLFILFEQLCLLASSRNRQARCKTISQKDPGQRRLHCDRVHRIPKFGPSNGGSTTSAGVDDSDAIRSLARHDLSKDKRKYNLQFLRSDSRSAPGSNLPAREQEALQATENPFKKHFKYSWQTKRCSVSTASQWPVTLHFAVSATRQGHVNLGALPSSLGPSDCTLVLAWSLDRCDLEQSV
jgi:hypothetical protein